MTIVKLKQKWQVTIPADIRSELNAKDWDIFDIKLIDWKIILDQIDLVMSKNNKKEKLSDYIWFAKWTWGDSISEIDEYLRNERNSWN